MTDDDIGCQRQRPVRTEETSIFSNLVVLNALDPVRMLAVEVDNISEDLVANLTGMSSTRANMEPLKEGRIERRGRQKMW